VSIANAAQTDEDRALKPLTIKRVRDLIRAVADQYPSASTDAIADEVVRRTSPEQVWEAYRSCLSLHVTDVERDRKAAVMSRPTPPSVPPPAPKPTLADKKTQRRKIGLSIIRDRKSATKQEQQEILGALARLEKMVEHEALALKLGDLALAECLDEKFYPHGVETRGADLTEADHEWLSRRPLPSIAGQIERVTWHRAVARVMRESGVKTTLALTAASRAAA
jgi:hypothetical protein